MDRADRPFVYPSITSLYDRFTPPSIIYDNPGCRVVIMDVFRQKWLLRRPFRLSVRFHRLDNLDRPLFPCGCSFTHGWVFTTSAHFKTLSARMLGPPAWMLVGPRECGNLFIYLFIFFSPSVWMREKKLDYFILFYFKFFFHPRGH
jgi:hypothetical protein